MLLNVGERAYTKWASAPKRGTQDNQPGREKGGGEGCARCAPGKAFGNAEVQANQGGVPLEVGESGIDGR